MFFVRIVLPVVSQFLSVTDCECCQPPKNEDGAASCDLPSGHSVRDSPINSVSMLVTRIGFDSLRESTPRSMDADSPPAICRRRRCELESLPVCRKTKGSVSARFSERLLVMVVVNAGAQGGVENQVLVSALNRSAESGIRTEQPA